MCLKSWQSSLDHYKMADNSNNLLTMMGPMLLLNNKEDSSSTSSYQKFLNAVLILICTQFIVLLSNYMKQMSFKLSFLDAWKKKRCCFHCKAKLIYQYERLQFYDITTSYYALQSKLRSKLLTDSKKTPYFIEEIFLGGTDQKFVNFVNPSTKYEIAPTILLEHTSSTKSFEKDNYSCMTYTITLTSTENDYAKLKDFVQDCTKAFDERRVGTQKIFIYTGVNEKNELCEFKAMDFDTTKTFDSMFFEQKKQIMDRIKKFNDGQAEYRRLGIPYTLGFMFYGAAGTGKTSVIKSIANYTQRHLVVIPVKRIKNINQLKNIFTSSYLNYTKIPNDKRLYVFEEIDCSEWAPIVRARHLKATDATESIPSSVSATCREQNNSKMMDLLMMNMLQNAAAQPSNESSSSSLPKSACTTTASPLAKEEPITLGDLLEVLDGIVETPGRMLIMTSNHPEHIDPALLRPGRIDLKVEFKKLRRQDVGDMYKLWFGEPMPHNVYQKLKDYMFTQAELGNILSLRDKSKIHSLLVAAPDELN